MLGSQTPRIRCVPAYVSSAGHEAIEVAALAGLHLDPWEQLILVDALGERQDGKWAAFEVGTEVPRQNGKGSILEARELAGLFAFGDKLLIHSAHEQLTATNHFNRLLNLIEGVPEFDRRILKAVRGKGSEAIKFRDGQEILFKTRTGGGGRGLTGDFVALDEAMILPVATTGALVPTMAARSIVGNPQLWYAWSAVDQENPKHDGVVVTRLRERAVAGAPAIAYFCFSADVRAWLEAHGRTFDPDRPEIEQITAEMLDDPEMWAQANPGLGIRISLEHIQRERAGALATREFAVERLGITDPPDTLEDSERVISRDAWAACAEHERENRIVRSRALAVDVNPDRTWGSIGVAGQREDGLWQFAVADRRRGTDWIVPRASELAADHPGASFVVLTRGPAGNLIEALRNAGLNVVEADGTDYAVACSDFSDAIEQRTARYPVPQSDLDEALSGARKGSQVENAWTWSRKASTSPDISPLVAVTLALWGAMHGGAPEVYSVREVAEQMGILPSSQPTTQPEPGTQTFVPLDQAPVHRGLFRP